MDHIIEGRDVNIREGFKEWQAESPPLLIFEGEERYKAFIYAGAPDRNEEDFGFTLYWIDLDNPLDEWAEHYTDVATAIVRLAVVARGANSGLNFQDGPMYFPRWSENLFRQTLTRPMVGHHH